MIARSATESSVEFTTAGLRISMLGPPGVKKAGRPLSISRRQTRALLYYLAAHLQPVPREQLCFLFWPDTPESTARRNFSRLLTLLRRALSTPTALVVSDDHVGLDASQVWADTATFERLCRAPGSQPRVEALQQAVDLYRGSFLTGFSLPTNPEFEAWMMQEQQTWERLYLGALATLIEARTVSGEYDAAIEYARRYLSVDDLAEDTHRRLIELYAAIGDYGSALRQFENCATILKRELGVSPLPETQAAYQAVLQGRPRPTQRATIAPTWATLPSLQAPLIGRDEELHRLAQTYEQARSGRGGVVLIAGEAGIGKSRLMQDFVTNLESEAMVVTGRGHETEQDLPYGPLIEALRPHLPAVNWSELDVELSHLAEVARLFPEMQTLLPNLPASVAIEACQEQNRLFLALTHWFLGLAAQRPPLILCLDDLQWADETTLSWLGYLGRRLERAALLVVGAYRVEDAARVAKLRAGLGRAGILRDVTLEGLLPVQVQSLLRRLSGQAHGVERLSRRLHQETGGNPFFLLETMRAMFEAGLLRQGEPVESYGELLLPDTVHKAIQDRLRHSSPQVQQVLEAGAVIGQQFDLNLVLAMSDYSESEVIKALETLLARQVIAEYGNKYRFKHGLVRTAVYRDLSYGRRRLLHRRAGEALENLRPDETTALVQHFERAEQPGKAARYALQAGLAAKTALAHTEARAHFDHALTLLEQQAAHLHEPEAITINQRLMAQARTEREQAH